MVLYSSSDWRCPKPCFWNIWNNVSFHRSICWRFPLRVPNLIQLHVFSWKVQGPVYGRMHAELWFDACNISAAGWSGSTCGSLCVTQPRGGMLGGSFNGPHKNSPVTVFKNRNWKQKHQTDGRTCNKCRYEDRQMNQQRRSLHEEKTHCSSLPEEQIVNMTTSCRTATPWWQVWDWKYDWLILQDEPKYCVFFLR